MKKRLSISGRIIFLFLFASVTMLSTNVVLNQNLNRIITKLDKVYATNVQLNHFSEKISKMNDNLYQYLYIKSSSSLEAVYQSEKELLDVIDTLSTGKMSSKGDLMTEDLCSLARSYINISEDAVVGKRGRNIRKYGEAYEKGERILGYVHSYVNTLGTMQLKHNSMHYEEIRNAFHSLEVFSAFFVIGILLIQVTVLLILTRNITRPLTKLSRAADVISEGNFNKDFVIVRTGDEIETLSKAVYKMVGNIRAYTKQVQDSMEKELLMEKHLADARLLYLQSQINPHFLFNCLNTGMQLAILEDAERTSVFIEKLAEFYRYNIGKEDEDSTLKDELEYVDYYMYIMDVRFMGTVRYKKELDEQLLSYKMPSMILQPLVENAVKHGLGGKDNTGTISISVEEKSGKIQIVITDDGIGIMPDTIKQIMNGNLQNEGHKTGNGVGIQNIMKRLELYFDCGCEEVFKIVSKGEGTTVLLTLPKV